MNTNDVKLSHVFFSELKQFNGTNFKTLKEAILDSVSDVPPEQLKAFSSVTTRYFIFCEKHPEIPADRLKMLYYQLKIDMIARFFSSYPAINTSDLIAFQRELQCFLEEGNIDAERTAV